MAGKEKHGGEKEPFVTKFARVLDLPQDSIGSQPHIDIASNRSAIIEGCKGILEYEPNVIRISTGKMIVKFTGRNLRLSCMNHENTMIEGFFTSVEFTL